MRKKNLIRNRKERNQRIIYNGETNDGGTKTIWRSDKAGKR